LTSIQHGLVLGVESSVQQTYPVVLISNTSDLFSESAILESRILGFLG